MTDETVRDDMTLWQTEGHARLDPGTFDIPISDIRTGYRSAVYFNRAKRVMQVEHPEMEVTMQVFQKKNGVLCGVDEAIAILKTCSGFYENPDTAVNLHNQIIKMRQEIRQQRQRVLVPNAHFPASTDAQIYEENLRHIAGHEKTLVELWRNGWEGLEVKALNDGDRLIPWEPVMTITGPYYLFAHLESVYLGILARQTRIATNTALVVAAALPKPVLFFADRFDHYATQGGDGYAAKIGGALGFASDAMTSWWGDKATGTMPHALIACYEGDTVSAAEAFHKHYPEADLIALVDFNNNCVDDAVECVRRFGSALWGVRLDTSETMVDCSIVQYDMGQEQPTGVNPLLVHKVRSALDANGGKHVQIVVSGGFTAEKISKFEANDVPADVYAVGSSLLHGSNDFTADIVKPSAKKGRWARNDSRLTVVE